MPKATLEYNLEEQDERNAHMRAVKSLDLTLAIWDMDQYLRGECKHGDLSDEAYDATEKAREKLFEILSNYNISIDELLQ
jgi:hypothetical protein